MGGTAAGASGVVEAAAEECGTGASTIDRIMLSAMPALFKAASAAGEVSKSQVLDLIFATRTSAGRPALCMFRTSSLDNGRALLEIGVAVGSWRATTAATAGTVPETCCADAMEESALHAT